MEQTPKKQHGGRRPGSGRPANDRNIPLMVRISQKAAERLATVGNKAEYIDNLIKQDAHNE